jgi:hypothetical protein
MTLVIPRRPAELSLAIERRWDGSDRDDPRLHGRISLCATREGLAVAGRLADPGPPHVPDAPFGTRVADLWNYDVLECFLVGAGGRYLEVELGAGGHFLLLSFSAPRQRCDEHESLRPILAHRRDPGGWRAALTLPWSLVPEGVCALNAFAAVRGELLAHHPLPGPEPDFHQPARYPSARLEP